MSDSEFLRRVAPPAKRAELPQQVLWTLRKDHRCAEARVRLTPIGMEVRFYIYDVGAPPQAARFYESRIFRAQEGGPSALHDYALTTRRAFELRGWALHVETADNGQTN